MKKFFFLLLLASIILTGCQSETMVKRSSFQTLKALEGEGYLIGLGPLDPQEKIQLFLENQGNESAEIEISHLDTLKGKVIDKRFSLTSKEKTIFPLRRKNDSQGKAVGYDIVVTSNKKSEVICHGDSYVPITETVLSH